MTRIAFGAIVLLCSAALGWSFVAARQPVVPEARITDRPVQIADEGYVSSSRCQACHPSQYASWYGSFHRTMTQVATPETVRADFDGVQIDGVPGSPIVLGRESGRFWADFGDPDWTGAVEARPRIRREIVMITGSHYQQVYWYRTGRTRVLGQLPATYLIADQRWIPRDAALLHPALDRPGSETGRWNAVCVNCHATAGKRRFEAPDGPAGEIAADTHVAEFGIACEACHGPAANHARANENPLRRYGQYFASARDPTIVQPATLEPARSSQVCGQCHAVWEHFDTADERRANAAGTAYRPGDDLADTRFIVQPTRNMTALTMRRLLEAYPGYVGDSFWSDGMVRVSGREYNGLIDSPCFANAVDPARTLTCFSCHTMHKPAEDPRSVGEWADTHQVGRGMEGNSACLQCHASIGTNVAAHTRHTPESTGSGCYNCHMPYTTYGLLRALRSHQISSPSVAVSVETGRPAACNACHLDKTLAWTSQYLEQWYGAPPASLGDDERNVAASLLWLMRGDAGQRALAAWSMGWKPAQHASGTSWMAVPLGMLLNDPYDAVRQVAYRSLRQLPGFEAFTYDPLGPVADRTAATLRVMRQWPLTVARNRRTDPALLLDGSGAPRMDAIINLGLQRNDRAVVLRE